MSERDEMREIVCVCERERRERVCVCVCVCVNESERKRGHDSNSKWMSSIVFACPKERILNLF